MKPRKESDDSLIAQYIRAIIKIEKLEVKLIIAKKALENIAIHNSIMPKFNCEDCARQALKEME